jgi:hypothetical protein
MTQLVETYAPLLTRIRLVQANWNTPTPGSLYAAFPPQEAFEVAQKCELHDTPVQGSWFKMAEIACAALSKPCLDRRLGDIATLAHEVAAGNDTRHRAGKTVRWLFPKTDARSTLHNKYPVGQD